MTKKSTDHRRLCGRVATSKYVQPPRFSRTASEILGHPPYYLLAPEHQYEPQFLAPQAYSQPQTAQPAAAPFYPTTTGGPPLALPAPTRFVPQLHRAVPTSAPTEWSGGISTDHFGYSPSPGLSATAYHTPPLPLPSDLKARPDEIFHPAPHRPILLPDVRAPLFPQNSMDQASHMPVSKTVRPPQKVHINPSDYGFNVGAIFREGSRFLPPATATSNVSSMPIPLSGSSPVLEHKYHRGGAPPGTLPEINQLTDPALQVIVDGVRQRFSCFIDYRWLRAIIVPEIDMIPSKFLATQGEAQYQKTVRSWVMTNTGVTIYEKIKEVLADRSLCDQGWCKVSYVWFVLLMREILVLSPHAQELGALVRLGALELDPCDPSFRFFPLRKAVWELLEAMNFRYSGGSSYDTYILQQRVQDHCSKGHIHISMAEAPFSTLYSRPGRSHGQNPDRVTYTNALRGTLLKLLNDGCGLDYLFLARCLYLDSNASSN